MATVKQAILLTFLARFYPKGVVRGRRYSFVVGVIYVNGMFWLYQILDLAVRCGSLHKETQAQCTNDLSVLLPAAVFNFVLDVVVFAIPVFCPWRRDLAPHGENESWNNVFVFAVV